MDTTAIAVGNGKLLSPESFKAMTNTKMRDQGGPIPGCPECHRGDDTYAYGMGVVIKGNWLLQDPLVNGYSALEAYLPSQRIAISLVVTFGEDAFDKTTGAYPNEAVPIFEQIGAKLAPERRSATGSRGPDPAPRRLSSRRGPPEAPCVRAGTDRASRRPRSGRRLWVRIRSWVRDDPLGGVDRHPKAIGTENSRVYDLQGRAAR